MLWHEHLYAQNIIMVQSSPFQIAPRAQAQLTTVAHRGHIFNGFLRGRSDERQFLKKKRKPVSSHLGAALLAAAIAPKCITGASAINCVPHAEFCNTSCLPVRHFV